MFILMCCSVYVFYEIVSSMITRIGNTSTRYKYRFTIHSIYNLQSGCGIFLYKAAGFTTHSSVTHAHLQLPCVLQIGAGKAPPYHDHKEMTPRFRTEFTTVESFCVFLEKLGSAISAADKGQRLGKRTTFGQRVETREADYIRTKGGD